MALNECAGCTTRFAVGLKRCPHCGSKDFHEEGAEPVAKITKHGGASDTTLPDEPEVDDVDEAEAESAPEPEEAPAVEPESEEGGEESSPGSSSETSTETQPPLPEPSGKPRRKPARTMASRSMKDPTDSSSASSTDGGQTEATSASDSE